MTIDATNLCSHLQKKLFESEGVYYPIWQAMQNDEELTAVVRPPTPLSPRLPQKCLRTGTIQKKTDVGIWKCNGDRYIII